MRPFILLVCLAVSFPMTAQNDRFSQAMTGIVSALDTARATSTFTAAGQQLERIATAEPDEWLPRYYLAYTQVQLAMHALERGDREACARLGQSAEVHITSARELTDKNSELLTVQGYVLLTRIWSDPMNDGPRLSPTALGLFQEAMALDEANPRPTFLLGMLTFHMPEFYGGGAANALPWLEKAAVQYAEAPADRGLLPGWGQGPNHAYLEKAREVIAAAEK